MLCAAGMSTSLLVSRMQEAAQKEGYEAEISAHPISQAAVKAADADVVLLGPQVRFHLAKEGRFGEARESILEGQRCFTEGHDTHLELLAMRGEGRLNFNLLIVHAEDQLMSAEGFGILAEEFVDVYRKMKGE